MPMILTERTAPLSYIKESAVTEEGKTYLGKLAGIGADFKNPTRNGRKYPLELWRNVENSDDFKEGMATHTIFGENDHPEERIDTSIKEISIVLTKFEIREDEGIVWTEFDIMDTPQGRILKSLLDYGSQIGVSSRGLGDEVMQNGETIIDPKTYTFYAWDAVVMPAVKSARPSVVESANRSTLKESFVREVENATTKAELESIRKIAENTKLPDLDSITESINNKLNDLDNGKDISSKLESDLGELAKSNEELQARVESLTAKLKAKDIRLIEARKLLQTVKSNSREMSKHLQVERKYNYKLEGELYNEAANTNHICDEYDAEVETLNENLTRTQDKLVIAESKAHKLQKQLSESRRLFNEQLESMKYDYEDKVNEKDDYINTLKSQLKESNNRVTKLESNRKLVESKNSKETQKISKELESATKLAQETLDKYIEVKCKMYNLTVEALTTKLPKEYTTSDIDRIVSELSSKQDRLNKLPISVRPVTVRLNENIGISDEDAQTLRFLKGFND